jgi:hypothetical protein
MDTPAARAMSLIVGRFAGFVVSSGGASGEKLFATYQACSKLSVYAGHSKGCSLIERAKMGAWHA